MAFVARRKDIGGGHPLLAAAEGLDVVDCLGGKRGPIARIRNQARYRATMAGDDNGFPALDCVEKLRKMDFGIGSLNFAHKTTS